MVAEATLELRAEMKSRGRQRAEQGLTETGPNTTGAAWGSGDDTPDRSHRSHELVLIIAQTIGETMVQNMVPTMVQITGQTMIQTMV